MLNEQRRDFGGRARKQAFYRGVVQPLPRGVLSLSPELGFHALAQRLQRIVALADALGELVVQFGQRLLFNVADRYPYLNALARHAFVGIVVRHRNLELFGRVYLGVNQRRRETGERPLHVFAHQIHRVRLVQHPLAVHAALGAQRNHIAHTHGPLGGFPRRHAAPELLHSLLNPLVVNLRRLFLHPNIAVCPKIHLRAQRNRRLECERLHLQQFHIGRAAYLKLLLVYRFCGDVQHHVVPHLIQDSRAPHHLHNDMARHFALAKARIRQMRAHLAVAHIQIGRGVSLFQFYVKNRLQVNGLLLCDSHGSLLNTINSLNNDYNTQVGAVISYYGFLLYAIYSRASETRNFCARTHQPAPLASRPRG